MRKKVSTIMDASLFLRAKVEAARQGKPLSAVIEEALERHLAGPELAKRTHLTVAESWGAMAIPADVLREIMEDDDDDVYA
jgi:hypothetical protein